MGVPRHLERAYELAAPHHPHPNPRVGAVVVSADGDVIGEGAHAGPPGPHAEIVALDEAHDARGATVYVSLEPCSHQGRTPPCVDRLISEDVATVVVGAIDPDSRVAGSGVARLEDAGIEVVIVDDAAAREVDPGYFHHRETGSPLVTVKWAMTLDGSIAARDGTSQWITGEDTRRHAHELRARADAVVVGAGTLRVDDPKLDVRLAGYDGHQPRPVIIAGESDLPESAQIWQRDPLVVATRSVETPAGELVEVEGVDGLPSPTATCEALSERGLYDVLLEGGPTLSSAWWAAGVIDRGVVYLGAKIGGGPGRAPMAGVFATLADAQDVELESVVSVSNDVIVHFKRSH